MSQPLAEQEIERLLEQLHNVDALERKRAIDMFLLRGIRDERVTQALKQMATQDSAELVRQAAKAALIALEKASPPPAEQPPSSSEQSSFVPAESHRGCRGSKNYATHKERILDFILGFVSWIIVTGVLWSQPVEQYSTSDNPSMIGLAVFLRAVFLFAGNIAVWLMLAFLRRWIAFGILVAFAINLIFALLLGVTWNGLCGVPFYLSDINRP